MLIKYSAEHEKFFIIESDVEEAARSLPQPVSHGTCSKLLISYWFIVDTVATGFQVSVFLKFTTSKTL